MGCLTPLSVIGIPVVENIIFPTIENVQPKHASKLTWVAGGIDQSLRNNNINAANFDLSKDMS